MAKNATCVLKLCMRFTTDDHVQVVNRQNSNHSELPSCNQLALHACDMDCAMMRADQSCIVDSLGVNAARLAGRYSASVSTISCTA